MFRERNRGIIFLVTSILIVISITSIFTFVTKPQVTLDITAKEGLIQLSHEGGEPLVWKDLRISVTKGKNTTPVYVDPTASKNPFGLTVRGEFNVNETVTIHNSVDGHDMENGGWYRVVVKHKPTNVKFLDRHVRVIENR